MPDIVVVGTGIGGLSLGIALKTRLGVDSFTIYERASDIGGVWRDNIYPGASPDVPIHFYSLSTDLNPDWSSTHGSQEETHAYWKGLVKKHNLGPHIQLNRRVVSADWNVKKQIYDIVIEDVTSGARSSTTALIFVPALGVQGSPHIPVLPGLGSFKGEMFHSAQWNTNVDLKGKRVAVIGNGSSAAQLVPSISEDSSVQVTQFCRTAAWLFPTVRGDYSPAWRWAFRHVPGVMRLNRWLLFFRVELQYVFLFQTRALRAFSTLIAKNYIRTAPAKYHERLIPNYTIGCKRLIVDKNYLESLHRANICLEWDDIETVTRDGITTKTGDTLPFDVIVFATGFNTQGYPLTIRGRDGNTVQEYYDSQGGAKAYLGMTMPGFPNLFMLFGPNTGTGHASVFFFHECQIEYILQFVKPILDGRVKSFEITARATDKYNDKIHARLARTQHTACTSWYREGGTGKVTGIFPGPGSLFWRWTRHPKWSDYTVEGTAQWDYDVGRNNLRRVINRTAQVCVLVILATAFVFRA